MRALDARACLLVAGTTGEGVWRSLDDGTTWTNFSAGLPADAEISRLVLAGALIFALVADTIFGPILWRSDTITPR